MSFAAPPPAASWRHEGARTGFEVAFFVTADDGYLIEGSTTATEDGTSWIVDYRIRLDRRWLTRSARIAGRAGEATTSTVIEADGLGGWTVDGAEAAQLSGCLDLDLESSAMTNTFPVHRERFPLGRTVAAPAAYVRANGLSVERLDQTYTRRGDLRYAYTAPAFGFACELGYDRHGLVLDYPGIATRIS
ncbi:putative glycolipid-binding domain-containing protein [Saccharomonospora sp. NPDC006951]